MLIYIEFALVVVLCLVAVTFHDFAAEPLAQAEAVFSRLARRKGTALLLVGGLAIAMRLAALPILPIPTASVDDEYSYLLQADTFLHGRLTNPTPALWTHFETLHINMRPTYQSKYPPAQALVLAMGTLIGGFPILGVWLSMAAMCMAICWMLQEWISPEWALAGGLIVAMRLSVFSYWGNSYWGGAVAAAGGALLLGGLVRLMKSPRIGDALLAGAGIAILANSRPYEGALLCIPVAGALLFWLLGKGKADFLYAMRNAILPLALCVAATAIAMGYYNWRVVGSPFRLPYQVYENTYGVSPLFIFQQQRPQPVYTQAALREYYVAVDLPYYQSTRSVRGVLLSWYQQIRSVWLLLLGPILTLPLLAAALIQRKSLKWRQLDWKGRFLISAGVISLAGLAMETYWQAHYAAPMTSLLILIVLLAMRRMRRWHWSGAPAGLFISRAVLPCCALMLLLRAAAGPLHMDTGPAWPPTWYNSGLRTVPREEIERKLQSLPGKSLVVVGYNTHGNINVPHEWIYNAPDIDSAKVIWAWDMGEAKNQELFDHFRDRQIWKIEVASNAPQ
jgi:hypothetical protein